MESPFNATSFVTLSLLCLRTSLAKFTFCERHFLHTLAYRPLPADSETVSTLMPSGCRTILHPLTLNVVNLMRLALATLIYIVFILSFLLSFYPFNSSTSFILLSWAETWAQDIFITDKFPFYEYMIINLNWNWTPSDIIGWDNNTNSSTLNRQPCGRWRPESLMTPWAARG